MAQVGGGTRPVRIDTDGIRFAPLISTPETLVDRDLITLAQPRPGVARVRNEYIETPLRTPLHHGDHHQLVLGKNDNKSGRVSPCLAVPVHQRLLPLSPAAAATASGHHHHRHSHHLLPVVTQQPSRAKKVVEGLPFPNGTTEAVVESHRESIICAECKRCKCDACRQPRPLPAAWICGDKYQCSAETLVDHCSCMCCVKGLFYHYADNDDANCADRPCSCSPHRRCQRWACVGLLTVLLPCLACYWPLRGTHKLCEVCYARYHNRGCQCVRRKADESDSCQQNFRRPAVVHKLEPMRGTTKRLLDTD